MNISMKSKIYLIYIKFHYKNYNTIIHIYILYFLIRNIMVHFFFTNSLFANNIKSLLKVNIFFKSNFCGNIIFFSEFIGKQNKTN